MRSLRALFVALPIVAACGTDLPNPEVNGVFPASGFIGRTVRVEVSGDSSEWSNAATVNFGDGITVNTVTVASPSALFADITIAPTATEGLHDVTVSDGGSPLVLSQAFELRIPVEITASSAAQGGFGSVSVRNLDLEHPFDTSTDAQGNFLLTLSAGPGVTLSVSNVTAFELSASALIDVDGASGPLTIVSGDLTSPGGPLPVTPRTATVLTAGVGGNTTVVPEGSLFEFTSASAGLLNVAMSSTDPNADNPGVVILPASGKWADVVAGATSYSRVVASGEKFYYVITDFGGFFGPVFGFDATVTPKVISLTGVTAVVDANNNETAATGQTVTGTVAQFNGTLTDTTDVDCFRIATGAVNKQIHVYTTDEDMQTDTVVEVFDNNNTTNLTLTGTDDSGFGEDMVTGTIATASTHGVCISNSSFGNAPNAPYKAFVVIE